MFNIIYNLINIILFSIYKVFLSNEKLILKKYKNTSDAILNNDLKGLIILYDYNYPIQHDTIINAIQIGNIECLKYIISIQLNKCQLTEAAIYASTYGHLDSLKLLLENNCVLHENIIYTALLNSHFDCFELALNYNCPFDTLTCIDILHKQLIKD